MQCPYKITGRTPGDKHVLVCRLCGHARQSKYPPAQVHRVCPGKTTLAEVLDRVHDYLADGFHGPMLPTIWPEIARRVTACYMTGCKKFNGRLCTAQGTACTMWDRWLGRLVEGACGGWESLQTTNPNEEEP